MSDPFGPVRARIVRRDIAATHASAARERLVALHRSDSEGLAVPDRIVADSHGSVTAESLRVGSADVHTVLAARGHLSLGECVWLGQGILHALACLHAQGVSHGDVSAANVVVGDSGVHLVDLVGPPGHGTATYSAPERSRGPSPAADVYAVGMLLKKAVADEGAIRLHAWIAPMIAPDPDLRPEAAVAARALERCHPPEPIAALELTPARDIRVRARATQERTLHDADGPRWWWRRLLRAYGTPVSAVCAVVVAGTLWSLMGGSFSHAQWATPTLDATYQSPEQAAVVLVNRWCQARSLGEYGLLAHVTSPLTPARRADDVWERQRSQ